MSVSGMNLRVQKWFGWFLNPEKAESQPSAVKEASDGTNPLSTDNQQPKTDDTSTETIEQLRENGIDEAQIQELEENRGDWIERDKGEIGNSVGASSPRDQAAEDGILHRILKSFTISTNANFTATESYRQLASGLSALEIWSLADDAKERTNSRRSNRYTARGSVEPWQWASLGTTFSTSESFRKSSSSTYTSHAESYEADLKLKAKETTSFQLRYSFTKRDNTGNNTTTSDSTAHTPSLSWLHTWGKETRTALGIRTTFRDQQRSGIEGNALIVTPNFSIDYRYHTENGIRIPFINKRIPLKHDLDLTNTLSWSIRRENFGLNREERSERYETTLRVGYKISTHITAKLPPRSQLPPRQSRRRQRLPFSRKRTHHPRRNPIVW